MLANLSPKRSEVVDNVKGVVKAVAKLPTVSPSDS